MREKEGGEEVEEEMEEGGGEVEEDVEEGGKGRRGWRRVGYGGGDE